MGVGSSHGRRAAVRDRAAPMSANPQIFGSEPSNQDSGSQVLSTLAFAEGGAGQQLALWRFFFLRGLLSIDNWFLSLSILIAPFFYVFLLGAVTVGSAGGYHPRADAAEFTGTEPVSGCV